MSLKWYHQARYRLVLLLAVFILPMLIAWFMVSHRLYWGTTQHGHLIQPTIDLNQLTLYDQHGQSLQPGPNWWLLYKPAKLCEQACVNTIHKMRQINIALGKNRQRVQRALLLSSTDQLPSPQRQQVEKGYPGMQLWTVHEPSWDQLMPEKMPKNLAFKVGTLYLIDPSASMLLAYPADVPGKAMLNDINRLLKVSKYHAKKP
jgi:hypothetical protein